MTVQNQNVKNVYRGNGSATVFPFTFAINKEHPEYIHVYITDDGGKAVETTDFTCDMDAKTITYPKPTSSAAKLSSTQRLTIYRLLPYTQELNLVNQGPFFAEDVETELDDLEMQIQQMSENLARCFQIGVEAVDFDMTMELEPDKVICVNSAGNGFEAREALMEVNGVWNGEGRRIVSVADPTASGDAATKKYVDENINYVDDTFLKLQSDGKAWEGRGLPVSNVATPGKVKDAATKEYVDSLIDNLSVEADRYVVFNTVAAMVAADLPAGYNTRTLGYHDINDGGAGTYSIRGKVAGETEDGGSVIFLANGNVAELIITDGKANIKQFGAYGDNEHDDTDAIVACANYCSSAKKILYSDNSTYKTTTNCIISMVDQIELHGYFTFLDVRYRHTIGNQFLQLIEKVDHLILRDYKNTTFHIGLADIVDIIADYAVVNGSSFSYCMFYGGYWETCNIIGGTTGGWVTENSFYRIRMHTLNIGINSSYRHNNNRFYDVTLEGGTINFDHANGNYVLCRAEGGVTVNTTSYSIHNIVETTYSASIGNVINITKYIKQGANIRTSQWFYRLRKYDIIKMDINNVLWNDNHDFTHRLAYIRGYYDGSSTPMNKAIVEFTEDMFLYIYGRGQTGTFFFLNSNSEIIDSSDIVTTGAFNYNSSSKVWSSSTGVAENSYLDAYLQHKKYAEDTPEENIPKYIEIRLRQASSASKIVDCGVFIECINSVKFVTNRTVPCSKTKPTLTTDVPVGFEVVNIGTNTAIWKWVFNGTEWVQIDYPTTQT